MPDPVVLQTTLGVCLNFIREWRGQRRLKRLSNVWVRVFCAPNATILLVYIPAKTKMSFSWRDDFFFAKIGIICKLIADNHIRPAER